MPDAPHEAGLRAELAAALESCRDDAAADALADALLSRDADGYVLVGVTADGGRGIYHQPTEWAVRSVALDGGELESLYTAAIVAEHVIRAADYVAAAGAGAWAWLHPRFRWAVPTE